MIEAPQQAAAQGLMAGAGLNLVSGGPCREKAQTIAKNQLKIHEREAAAWRWLDAAMAVHNPTDEEEAALWEVLSRAQRRERY